MKAVSRRNLQHPAGHGPRDAAVSSVRERLSDELLEAGAAKFLLRLRGDSPAEKPAAGVQVRLRDHESRDEIRPRRRQRDRDRAAEAVADDRGAPQPEMVEQGRHRTRVIVQRVREVVVGGRTLCRFCAGERYYQRAD